MSADAEAVQMAGFRLAEGEPKADEKAFVREFLKENSIAEVAVCGMDYDKKLLTGVDGRVYFEPYPNFWTDCGGPSSRVVYVGTGKHAGGIVLSPLYVKIEGTWRRTLDGSEVPAAAISRIGVS